MICIGIVDLSALDEQRYQALYHMASKERQQRADRYLRKEDSRRCIAADGLLRYAMRQALGTDRLERSCSAKGKPFLPEHPDFYFNLSHSGSWVVIAWGDCPVGIDVETLELTQSKEQLVHRYFCSDERDYVLQAQDRERSERFFEIWTKKESYLKYLGTGIDRALNSFSVLHAMDAVFDTRSLGDAMLTVCSRDSQYQIIPVSVELLLSG